MFCLKYSELNLRQPRENIPRVMGFMWTSLGLGLLVYYVPPQDSDNLFYRYAVYAMMTWLGAILYSWINFYFQYRMWIHV